MYCREPKGNVLGIDKEQEFIDIFYESFKFVPLKLKK